MDRRENCESLSDNKCVLLAVKSTGSNPGLGQAVLRDLISTLTMVGLTLKIYHESFANSLLFVHTYTQKIIASSYKYYRKIVAKTGHPAVMYVHYKMVLAAFIMRWY
jgi:hypothetical protein